MWHWIFVIMLPVLSKEWKDSSYSIMTKYPVFLLIASWSFEGRINITKTFMTQMLQSHTEWVVHMLQVWL